MFTILLFVYYFVLLFKGSYFQNLMIEMGEEAIRKQKEGDKYKADEKFAIKILFTFVFIIFLTMVQLTYKCIALGIGDAKLISAAVLAYTILSFALNLSKNKTRDLSTEIKINKYRSKLYQTRTFRGTVNALIFTAYYGYMFYILVF